MLLLFLEGLSQLTFSKINLGDNFVPPIMLCATSFQYLSHFLNESY